tara:strand:+ start:194 stop:694 length:501 start_codon:yes stop_codon:yes gene_type:complete
MSQPIKNKWFNDQELKNLHDEIVSNQREMTEKELEVLREMFWSKFGTAYYGMCMNPLFLIEGEDNPFWHEEVLTLAEEEKEREEIKLWELQTALDEIDGIEREIPDYSIEALCENPDQCASRKRFGNSCKCVRNLFVSEGQFLAWRKQKLKELKQDMLEIFLQEEN